MPSAAKAVSVARAACREKRFGARAMHSADTRPIPRAPPLISARCPAVAATCAGLKASGSAVARALITKSSSAAFSYL